MTEDADLTGLFEALAPEDRALIQELVGVESQLIDVLDRTGVDSYVPLDHQRRFHELPTNNRWMIGGNRMGKSYALFREIRWFALGDHPFRSDIPDHGFIWACCASNEVVLNHMLPGVRQAVGESNIKRIVYKPVPTIELHNGKAIVFKFYEQSPLKYAGQEPILIALDEEPPWDIMEECYARRSARHDLNIAGTVTPVKGLTWLFDKVVNNGWPEAMYVGGQTTDNVHLPKAEVDALDRGLHGVMREIRFLGKILPIGGSMVFNPDRLARMMRSIREPIATFERERGRWIQVEEGPLRLYGDRFLNERGRWEWMFPWDVRARGVRFEYVIGVDVAEGLNTSHSDAEPDYDESSAHVKNRHTQHIVAEYTSGITEPDFLGEEILPSMSDIFNQAKVNIEANNHGHTTISFFKRKYPNRLYIPPDERTDRQTHLHERYGYQESEKGRRYLVDLMKRAVRDNADYYVPSVKALRQMLTFVLKSNGRMEHQDGAKDDCVFSLGLCEVLDMDSPRPRPLKITQKERDLLRAQAQRDTRLATDWYRRVA